MSNNIQKDAQLLTKIKEKISPTGKRKSKILPTRWSPLRFLGKSLLKRRSPDVYGEALSIIEKADPILRETVSNQKINLAEMKKYQKGLSVTGFAVAANRFANRQRNINAVIAEIGKLFIKIANKKGVTAAGSPENIINTAINIDIGKRPGMFEKNEIQDVDDQKYIEDQLQRLSEMYCELSKQALWGGRYWRTKTKSGRDFEKKFKLIYAKFEMISKRNVSILEELDELLDVGDPGEYLKQAKKVFNIDEVLKDKDVAQAWEIFMQKPPPDDQIKPEPPTQAPASAPVSTQAPVSTTVPDIAKTPMVPPPPMEPPKAPTKPLPPPPVSKKPEDTYTKDQMDAFINANAHEEFIKKLTKKANAGKSPIELAKYILKYAEKIDEIDTEYSLKLTAIAEGMLEDE